jgi:hypothetical protein
MTVWTERDLPVLEALSAPDDEHLRLGYLTIGHGRGAEALGITHSDDAIYDSLLTLRDAGYVDFDMQLETGPGAHFTQLALTGAGYQALGEWPLFDEITSPETMALLLEHLAEEAPTEEETQNMRRAARYVRSLGGDAFRRFVVGAMAALIRAQVGLE